MNRVAASVMTTDTVASLAKEAKETNGLVGGYAAGYSKYKTLAG